MTENPHSGNDPELTPPLRQNSQNGISGAVEPDLREIWSVFYAGRKFILIFTFLCLLLAAVYGILAEEIYEAKAVAIPADQEASGGALSALANQFGGIAALAGVNLTATGGKAEEALQILKTFSFTSEFIEAEGIADALFPPANRDDSDPAPTMQQAVQRFNNRVLDIYKDGKTGAVTITIAWNDPIIAARWANRMIARLNDKMRSQDISVAQRSIAFLNQKLEETPVVEMRVTLYRLIEAQTKTVMLANVSDEYVYKLIDPAYPPDEPAHPRRGIIVLLGLLFGAVFGSILVWSSHFVQAFRIQ